MILGFYPALYDEPRCGGVFICVFAYCLEASFTELKQKTNI